MFIFCSLDSYLYLCLYKSLKDIIMKLVHELNQNELEELREAYFNQLTDLGEEEFDSIEDLPMGNVISHYEGISFVDEDFFCNI